MQVITPVFSNGELEDFEVVMEAWCVIITAFSGDPHLAAKPRIRATVINPIQYTVGHHCLAKVRVGPQVMDSPYSKDLLQCGCAEIGTRPYNMQLTLWCSYLLYVWRCCALDPASGHSKKLK